MPAKANLIGQRFGKLVVIEESKRRRHEGRACWVCQCDCGNTTIVETKHLRNGETRSCGCLRTAHWYKHGLSKTRIAGIWNNMKQRCENPNGNEYKYYGGRGITVCQEWHDLPAFVEWAMSHGYSDGLTIDRINTNGNYTPENCRWVTQAEQMKNTRRVKHITYNGETHNMTEWANIIGAEPTLVRNRLALGWSIEEALTTPADRHKACRYTKQYTCNGETHSASEWAKIRGLDVSTIRKRLQRGFTIEQALGFA